MLKAKNTSSFTNLLPIDWFQEDKRLNKPNEPTQELNNRLPLSSTATKVSFSLFMSKCFLINKKMFIMPLLYVCKYNIF